MRRVIGVAPWGARSSSLPGYLLFAEDSAVPRCSIGAAGFRPRSQAHDAGLSLSPCARNTIREAISRDTSSSQHAGHAVRRNRTRSAAGTRSAVTASAVGGSATTHQKCGSAESLRRRAARREARVIARRGGRGHNRRRGQSMASRFPFQNKEIAQKKTTSIPQVNFK